MRPSLLLAGTAGLAFLLSAQAASAREVPATPPEAPVAAQGAQLIPAQTFELENGLRVIFHIDRSDPVTAVVLAARVGSAREEPGRTGFAHLFEHLFFLNSENLGPGGLDRMSARIGGSGANGSTSFDLTDYLQTVPNDALEKMIWAEADKLGYFINTVTDPVLAKEKQVVKNEKRQSVDNQPYGHAFGVTLENLFPEGHPYSWPVIGSLADLDAATLEDVQAFYRRWYTPNNSTLVIAGDFDPDQARAWVEKYFGEIPRGEEAPVVRPQPASLPETRRLMHEDNFARLPRLSMTWPGVERGHPDEAALDTLLTLLTDGRDAPLTKLLVEEARLTDSVGGFSMAQQVAGMAQLQVTAFDGTDLDLVHQRLNEGLARFERDGVDAAALERVKTQAEAGFYGGLGSVLGKGAALARYDLYGTTADADLAAIRAVTADDVMRVYATYLKGKPFVATSFVPKGQTELALEGSEVARVVIEPIVQGAEAAVDPNAAQETANRSPSAFDRTIEPPSGPAPVVTPPAIWNAALPNGVEVSGIRNDEVPLVTFQLSVDGGQLLDDPAEPGAANLLAALMNRGTARKTPAELENAFKALGATVNVSSGEERFLISGTTLSRNFGATIDLVEEMLFEPRWDATELELLKSSVVAQLAAQKSQPTQIAERVYDVVAYGDDHILSRNRLGTPTSVESLTMDDLKTMLQRWSPSNARFRVVGDIDQTSVTNALTDLGARWENRSVEIPSYAPPRPPERSQVVFYDLPGAAQSVFVFGSPSLTRADEDYYPGVVMNYRLGGGGFASRLTQQLREGAGYTYGVNSGFQSRETLGDYALRSSVRSNVTPEAATLARDIMRDYGATFTPEDLDVTRSALSRSRARAFESAGAKLGVLEAIGDYGLPVDYLSHEAEVVQSMTVEQIQALADRLIDTDAMVYVVVGDAASQEARLEALGYGEPIRINDRLEAADR
ncbi:insulinase family protein [Roseibacterium beibuensis]|uniref:M16 family metallopeptidase n=1 Tax=[Roseibacterium] beibuensis TaxID=1193142 RepID=UPI00217D1084|nr:pitrilysin family protein [Roseibacterium beibuensis]MCS6625090.1 insulinase family protein [Roseibacterium beibuensis]